MLRWYRDLVQLRRETPSLLNGRLDQVRVRFDEAGGWLHMQRGEIGTLVNFAPRPAVIPLEEADREVILASDPECSLESESASLPAESVLILRSQ
jgi:maltooligosyltrehalose trehalohydrolase